MNPQYINRTLTPPDKGGSQWEEQDAAERTLEWVRKTFTPQQVFGDDVFEKWALDNGWILPETNKT